jgi:ABC-2 type transport system permease protein
VSRLLALTRRELMAYFFSPVPYLVMFLFLLTVWFFFSGPMNAPVVFVSYQPVIFNLVVLLLFLMPLLTMNSVAEERTSNTLETLLTAPVTDWQVILSKWAGTFVFYVVMLALTLVYWPILSDLGHEIGKPDVGPMLAGYVGALLLGGLYIAIGIFASSLTENSLLSAFVAFCVAIGLLLIEMLSRTFEASAAWAETAGRYLSQQSHFEQFVKGQIPLYDVIYFVSFTVFFLFLAVRALESRKWR